MFIVVQYRRFWDDNGGFGVIKVWSKILFCTWDYIELNFMVCCCIKGKCWLCNCANVVFKVYI